MHANLIHSWWKHHLEAKILGFTSKLGYSVIKLGLKEHKIYISFEGSWFWMKQTWNKHHNSLLLHSWRELLPSFERSPNVLSARVKSLKNYCRAEKMHPSEYAINKKRCSTSYSSVLHFEKISSQYKLQVREEEMWRPFNRTNIRANIVFEIEGASRY